MSKQYVKLIAPYHKMNIHSVYEIKSEHYDYFTMKNGIKVPKNLVTFNIHPEKSKLDDYWEGDIV